MASDETRSDTAATLAVPSIDAARLLRARGATVIDLRSPSEFAEDHVPGAVNRPLFDDAERAVVGTLYRRAGSQPAFDAGLELTVAKVAALVDSVLAHAGRARPEGDARADTLELAADGMAALEGRMEERGVDSLPEGALVLHCWRGGLRSRSVGALLVRLGVPDVVVLRGGYKGYRARVREELAEFEAPPAVVLRGLTGVGKTLVLRAIEASRPGWTIDLEGCAGHRSSILGMVGLEPVGQKRFESRLAARARDGLQGPATVYEGESRKVGDAIVPERLWAHLRGGVSLELAAPTAVRVRNLIEDYLATEANRPALAEQLPFIEERLGRTKYAGVLTGLLARRRDAELVELLLERYYDPLYRRTERERAEAHGPPAATLDASDPDACAAAVVDWVEARAERGEFGST